MQDLGPAEGSVATRLAETLSRNLADANFEPVSTPLMEETELFTRKGGVELTGSLYAFTDPGGRRVSLRPEFTSSVIRYVAENQKSMKLPARLRYRGPVFRYHRGGNGTYRQYTQVGGELIGASGPDADAEIVSVAVSGLNAVGIANVAIRIGHLGILNSFLESFGLSPAANRLIIGSVKTLRDDETDDLLQEARAAGLIRSANGASDSASPDPAALGDLLRDTLGDAMSKPVGRRTTEEILARLMRKSREANDPVRFTDAVSFFSQLIRLDGKPADVVSRARKLCAARKVSPNPLDELDALIKSLAGRKLNGDSIRLDLGFARGVAYYTGLVFELTTATLPAGASLGGGGRYDGLIETLGGKDCAALGFAYDLDYVLLATKKPAKAKAKS
ncbi:MAG: HisS family protein [Chloroflexi bacterium]|nr:HisS family protein [Chloroflexota bacterium]